MRNKGAGNKGLTLIEIVIVVGIASMMIYSAYFLMIGAIDSSRKASNRTVASHLATKKIEELRQEAYEDIISQTETETVQTTTFTITVTANETIVDDTSKKDIRITVNWTDPDETTLIISETTITPETVLRTPS